MGCEWPLDWARETGKEKNVQAYITYVYGSCLFVCFLFYLLMFRLELLLHIHAQV